MGKLLIFFGIILVILGILLNLGIKPTFLGRLSGDICIKKEKFYFYPVREFFSNEVYFPITTCLLLSVILTLILRLFAKR